MSNLIRGCLTAHEHGRAVLLRIGIGCFGLVYVMVLLTPLHAFRMRALLDSLEMSTVPHSSHGQDFAIGRCSGML